MVVTYQGLCGEELMLIVEQNAIFMTETRELGQCIPSPRCAGASLRAHVFFFLRKGLRGNFTNMRTIVSLANDAEVDSYLAFTCTDVPSRRFWRVMACAECLEREYLDTCCT